MKFKRINENTVRCIIYEEDMIEHGVVLEDFLSNKNSIQEFLHKIVQMAMSEVGYEAKSGMLSMQVMQLPMNALAITFSEKSGAEFQNMIDSTIEAMDGVNCFAHSENKEDAEESTQNKQVELFDEFIKGMMHEVNNKVNGEQNESNHTIVKKKVIKEENDKSKKVIRKIFRFEKLTDFEKYCSVINFDKPIKSELYKDELDGKYYLIIEKARLSKKNFNMLCEIAVEYGNTLKENPFTLTYFNEHFTYMIKKKAIHVIRSLSR